jgi:hypothetical protein
MGTTRRPKLSPVKLKEAFDADLAAAWAADRSRRAEETPYAFVLYGVEGGPAWLWPYVLTEEGLTRVATRYLKEGYHDTLGEARDELRWSVADAPAVQRGPEPELDERKQSSCGCRGRDGEEEGEAARAFRRPLPQTLTSVHRPARSTPRRCWAGAA